MKREAASHTKLKRLCRKLDLQTWQAAGLLEMIWILTARETPRGNIGRLSDEDIAVAIDYRGDEHAMIEALVESGWLDRSQEHRLIIHDWSEHCDDTVHAKLARARQSFADGSLPKARRLTQNERDEFQQWADSQKLKTAAVGQPSASQKVETAAVGQPKGENGACLALPSLALPSLAGERARDGAPPAAASPPLAPGDFAEPTPDEHAALLVAECLNRPHWAESDRRLAIGAATKILTRATNPRAQREAISARHAEYASYYATAPPGAKRKALEWWLTDEIWLHPPPRAPVQESRATQLLRQKNREVGNAK